MRTQRKSFLLAAAALAGLAVAACDSTRTTDPAATSDPGPGPLFAVGNPDAELAAYMNDVNLVLASEGANYRVAVAEYVTDGAGGEFGGTVLAKDVGNKRLTHDFVPFDVRRVGWSGPVTGSTDNITYAIDQTGDAVPVLGGLTAAQTTAAIGRAHDLWEVLPCSILPQIVNPDFGLDIGVVAFLNGLGGSPFVFADVQHAGWRDINFAGGILGVTFTFIFTAAGTPTDIDNNGRLDTAFREIYYDPSFNWADDGAANIDVETVAAHEIGHGLSQAHFGKVWLKNDGSLAASPRALMNALYAGPFRMVTGSDNGGHCGNWAQWPLE